MDSSRRHEAQRSRRAEGQTLMLVIGHDFPSDSVLTQAGTLTGWAEERVVALRPVMARDGLPDPRRVGEHDAVAVLGSVEGAWDDTVPWLAEEIAYLGAAVEAGVPILGLCFGGQLLARLLGGRAVAGGASEHGWHTVDGSVGWGDTQRSGAGARNAIHGPWMEFHSDSFTVPPGARTLATSARCTQAFAHGPHLGVQFHPEITPDAYAIWAGSWAGTPFESEDMPAMGVSTEGLRAEVAAHADASAAAARALYDSFAEQAGLATRMLAS